MEIWCKSKKIEGLGMDSTCVRPKTWTSGSGRSVSGSWAGRVGYWKYKVSIKCPLISSAQYKEMVGIFETEPQIFPVKIIDDTGKEINIKMYAGDMTYSEIVYCDNGEKFYKSVSVELVER